MLAISSKKFTKGLTQKSWLSCRTMRIKQWVNLSIQIPIWIKLLGWEGSCDLQFLYQALCPFSQISSWPWQNGYRFLHPRQPSNLWVLQPFICGSSVWPWSIASSTVLQEHTEATGRYQWGDGSLQSLSTGIRSFFPLHAWLDQGYLIFHSFWFLVARMALPPLLWAGSTFVHSSGWGICFW